MEMNEELRNYIEKQRLYGISDPIIRKMLLDSGWDSDLVDSAFGHHTVPDVPPTPPTHSENNLEVLTSEPYQHKQKTTWGLENTHLNASQALLTVGLILILVAATVIVFYNWSSLTPIMRFLVAAIPNLLLFIIGYYSRRQSTLSHIDDGTNAVGLLLLPVTIGTFYFQFNIVSNVDSFLFFLSAVTAIPCMIAFDYWRRQAYAAVLTAVMIAAAVIFFGMYQEWNGSTWYWVGVLFGIATFITAVVADRMQNDDHRTPYEVISAIAFFFFVPLFLADLIKTDNSPSSLILFAFAAGLAGMVVGSCYRWLFAKISMTEFQLQRFVQFGALLSLIYPVIGLIGNQSIYVVPSLIVAAILILLAMLIGVNLMFVMGVTDLAISLLMVLFKELTDIKTPIFLFMLGFFAIGLSMFLGRIKVARQSFYQASLAKSLGVISDKESESLGHTTQNLKIHPALIILLLLVLAMAFG